ncbi:hypothetical protein TrCOL_g13776, partial [Triparma columacea]
KNKCKDHVGFMCADNYVMKARRQTPKKGEGVIFALDTSTVGLGLFPGEVPKVVDNAPLIVPFSSKLVLDNVEKDNPFVCVKDTSGVSDLSKHLPSASKFAILPQLFCNFGSFETYCKQVIKAFIRYECPFYLTAQDLQGHWALAKLHYMISKSRTGSEEEKAAALKELKGLEMDEPKQSLVMRTIPTLAQFHVQKHLLEGLAYNDTDYKNFVAQVLNHYGEIKHGRQKGLLQTKKAELDNLFIPQLQKIAASLGVELKGKTTKPIIIEAILDKRAERVAEEAEREAEEAERTPLSEDEMNNRIKLMKDLIETLKYDPTTSWARDCAVNFTEDMKDVENDEVDKIKEVLKDILNGRDVAHGKKQSKNK